MKANTPEQDYEMGRSRMFRKGQSDDLNVIKVDPVVHELAPIEAAEVERNLQDKARGH